MEYQNFIVKTIHKEFEDTYRLQLVPKENSHLTFSPGQYVYVKNPHYKPEEDHPFSLASSPFTHDHIELCIKQYGDWTKEIENMRHGDILKISKPQGSFIWEDSLSDVVFLLGGLGISPIMSMLRTIEKKGLRPRITMLYGNRTPESIAYKEELKRLEQKLPELKIVHIFSHLPDDYPWSGYRGFITEEIVRHEIDLEKNPSFFIVGPPVFLEKMHDLLEKLHVPQSKINEENLS